MRINFNEALATLSETMTAIGGNSMAVRSGSEEMRTGADDLAGRTERQAASITETANAIDAITQSVRLQIERAEQAERIARDAKKETTGSSQIMRETIAAMEAIQSSSRQINTIISVIDDIAFQTNLLALNAGVEAARAGESGKGFAVVAMEVRELAQRSSSAAKEIASLLQKSTHEVETGVSLVERAGVALTGIGSHVEAINGQIHEIMESTREEADTLRADQHGCFRTRFDDAAECRHGRGNDGGDPPPCGRGRGDGPAAWQFHAAAGSSPAQRRSPCAARAGARRLGNDRIEGRAAGPFSLSA